MEKYDIRGGRWNIFLSVGQHNYRIKEYIFFYLWQTEVRDVFSYKYIILMQFKKIFVMFTWFVVILNKKQTLATLIKIVWFRNHYKIWNSMNFSSFVNFIYTYFPTLGEFLIVPLYVLYIFYCSPPPKSHIKFPPDKQSRFKAGIAVTDLTCIISIIKHINSYIHWM